MTTLDLYIATFSETFINTDISQLNDLKYQSVPDWDSIGHLTLIAGIEQAFEISMEMDDIIEFSSFQKGIEILRKYDVEI